MTTRPQQSLFPLSNLTALSDWFAEQKTLDRSLSQMQTTQLNHYCEQLYDEFLPVVSHYDSPHHSIVKSQAGCHVKTLHAGILLMGPQSATPIHNHADSFSLSLVLSGAVTCIVYRETSDNNNLNDICEITKKQSMQLGRRQFSSLPGNPRLLHQLSTGQEPACMLDITFPPIGRFPRDWFLPITSANESPIFCKKAPEGKFPTKSRVINP